MKLRRSTPCSLLSFLAVAGAVALFENPAHAAGIIKNPGDHPDYSVELEPHGLLDWDQHWYFNHTGFGLGMHAAIPFVDNGPVKKINNNIGIGFGLDWSHFSDNGCGGWWWGGPRRAGIPYGYDCTGNELTFPVYMQWNFFFTDIISVSAEAGFSIVHGWADVSPCPIGYDCGSSDTTVEPYFEGAGRFLFGDTVGLMVRVGWPFLTVGADFLL